MRPVVRVCVVPAVIVVVLAMAAMAQAASFGAVQKLSAVNTRSNAPFVAVGADGVSSVVWSQMEGSIERIRFMRVAADGTPGVVKLLDGGGFNAQSPAVAVGPDGAAHVVWQRFDGTNWRIQYVRVAVDGSIGAVQTLDPGGQIPSGASIAVGSNGAVHIVWTKFIIGGEDRVQYLRINSGGSLSGIQTLDAGGGNAWTYGHGSEQSIALDAAGNAYVGWIRFDGMRNRMQLVKVPAVGARGQIATLDAGTGDVRSYSVAADASGVAHVAWEQTDGSLARIQVTRIAANGTQGAVQTVASGQWNVSFPWIAVGTDGAEHIVWSRGTGVNHIEYLRVDDPKQPLAATVQLDQSTQWSHYASVGVDAAGGVHAVWLGLDGSVDVRVHYIATPVTTPRKGSDDQESEDKFVACPVGTSSTVKCKTLSSAQVANGGCAAQRDRGLIMVGTAGSERFVGSGKDDIIRGEGGNDVIIAGAGNDSVYGGAGNDMVDGGDGNDCIHGNNGSDSVHGRNGDDMIYGEEDPDSLFGEGGKDSLFGGVGFDIRLDGGVDVNVVRPDDN